MPKPRMVTVTAGLVKAVQDLHKSKHWTLLPLSLRDRIERGLKGEE